MVSTGAGAALWAALRRAGPEGVSIGELLALTGMSRPTLYRHPDSRHPPGGLSQLGRG